MSRTELAEAVNQWLHTQTGQTFDMDGAHIGKYELGEYRWPREYYRRALRAVLRVSTDADLGFRPHRRSPPTEEWTPPADPDPPADWQKAVVRGADSLSGLVLQVSAAVARAVVAFGGWASHHRR